MMDQDRPMTGILLMLCFCALAPLGDFIAKLLGGVVPLLQLLLFRFAIQAVILTPLTAFGGARMRMSARVFYYTLLRTVLHILGVGAMFLSLRYLPLADAIAIAFVMPFILLFLARFVSGEEVGPRRFAACCAGFAGTLLVVQPSFAEFGLPALLPLYVALNFALFMMVTRKIARAVDPVSLQCVSGWVAAFMLGAFYLAADGLHGDIAVVMLDAQSWALIAATGVLGTVAHLVMTWSLRYAPAATLAPVQYMEIPFATTFGWLIFEDFPDALALAGIAVSIASGLYIILVERAAARAAPPAV